MTKLESATKEVVAVMTNGVIVPNQTLLVAFSLVVQDIVAEVELIFPADTLLKVGGVTSNLRVLNDDWEEVARLPAKSLEPTAK